MTLLKKSPPNRYTSVKIIATIIFSAYCAIHVQGQETTGKAIKSDFYENLTPTSPKSSSLGSFGNTPINYYTGLPEISIPLVTLSSRDITVPISINYDATGIRTDELAGAVGMKWSLNAGGFVSREMKGLPDELPTKGYLAHAAPTNYYNVPSADIDDWVNWTQKNEKDGTPDEFAVVVNGRCIKFVFDRYGNAVTIPRQNVKITKTITNNKITGFEMLTEDGMKYVFGGGNTIEERKIESLAMTLKITYSHIDDDYSLNYTGPVRRYYTNPGLDKFDPNYSSKENVIDFYNSKWYLAKIIAPTGDYVDFNYTKLSNNIQYAGKPSIVRIRASIAPILYYVGPDGWTPPNGTSVYVYRKFTRTDPGSSAPPLPPFGISPTDHNLYFPPEEYRVNAGGAFATHTLITESSIVLNTIVAANGNQVTLSTSDRADLPYAKQYDAFTLRMNGQNVRTARLNYAVIDANENEDFMWVSEAIMLSKSSFGATGTLYANFAKSLAESNVNDVKLRKYVFEGLKQYNYKRLFLESVDGYGTGSQAVHEYAFEYQNRNLLRRRTTPMYDYLGFSRDEFDAESDFAIKANTYGKVSNSRIPNSKMSASITQRFPTRGILNKITYPTLGHTLFTYTTNFGPKLTLIEDFTSQGVVSQKEIQYVAAFRNTDQYIFSYVLDLKVGDTNDWIKTSVVSSSPHSDVVLTHGAVEGNKEVKVYNGLSQANQHQGWEVFKYTAPTSFSVTELTFTDATTEYNFTNDAGAVFTDFRDVNTPALATPVDVNAAGESLPNGVKDIFPFPKKTDRDHLRGLLFEHSVYNKSGTLVSRTRNCYKVNPYGYAPQTVTGFNGGSYVWASGYQLEDYPGSEVSPQTRYRYGKVITASNWVVLNKTIDYVYDQDVPTKTIANVKSFTYDPTYLQLTETKSFQVNDPSRSVTTKTKFPTHNDYTYPQYCASNFDACRDNCPSEDRDACWQECQDALENCMNQTGTPEAAAVIKLTKSHQINTPIETQTWLEQDSYLKLINATATKFNKIGSNDMVKPVEIWAMNRPLSSGDYQESKIESTGEFSIDDDNMRKVHSFVYDASTGKLAQHTPIDGQVMSYTWGYGGSLVTSQSINQQHTSVYYHIPGVGMSSTTDPNGITTTYHYDPLNRLKLTKDYANNILSRLRYNYANQGELSNQVSVSGSFFTGDPINFSASDNVEFGPNQFTYNWSFGDGNSANTSYGSATHTYSAPGTYVMNLNKTNPEYTPITISKTITIYPQPSITLNVTGSTYVNKCVNNGSYQQPSITATLSGGCTTCTYTYNWTFSRDGGYPQSFGGAGSNPVGPPPGFDPCGIAGSYQVWCSIYEGGNLIKTSEPETLTVAETTENGQPCACGIQN